MGSSGSLGHDYQHDKKIADNTDRTASALEQSALSSARTAQASILVATLSFTITAYFAYQDYYGDEQWIKQQRLLAENRDWLLLRQIEALEKQNTHLQTLIDQIK